MYTHTNTPLPPFDIGYFGSRHCSITEFYLLATNKCQRKPEKNSLLENLATQIKNDHNKKIFQMEVFLSKSLFYIWWTFIIDLYPLFALDFQWRGMLNRWDVPEKVQDFRIFPKKLGFPDFFSRYWDLNRKFSKK